MELEEEKNVEDLADRDMPKSLGNRVGRHFRERPLTKWLLALALVIILVGVIGAYDYFTIRESTDDAQIDGHINPIAARIGGTVIQVNVHDNQYVKAGTVLVQIDPKDYKVALAKAQADLSAAEAIAHGARTQVPVADTTTASQISNAQAMLERAEGSRAAAIKDVDMARARLVSAQARLREVEVNYIRSQHDFERMKQLIAKDEVSQQQYDAAFAISESMHASRDLAEASIKEAQESVGAAEARVTQANGTVLEAKAAVTAAQTGPQQVTITKSRAATAEAQVMQAKAVVDQAELNLSYTTVVAPVDGIVSKKNVEVGQIIQPGQPLFAIVPLEDVWVTANFKENQLKNMRPGQLVTISVDAYGGRSYTGHIDSIAAATGARFSLLPPENATGNYVKVVQRVPVKILLDKGQDQEHLLRPGMSVEASVITK